MRRPGYALFEPGPDGVTDTVNTIQGVRSYDPAMGTWTTPDAYAGDVSDPMSRKSYMWDRNNAFAYSDPTGYFEMSVLEGGGGGGGDGGEGVSPEDLVGSAARAGEPETGKYGDVRTEAQKAVNKQVPKHWDETRNKLSKAIKRFKPGTKGATHVRIMSGNPNDPNPIKQNPYVRAYSQGNPLDANGNMVPKSQGIIPAGQFIFDKVFHE